MKTQSLRMATQNEMMSTRDKILNYYKKTVSPDGTVLYSTKNPRSIFEILYPVVGNNYFQQYESSTFCKQKHNQLNKRYHGYSFHTLTENEMEAFIEEVSTMV